MGVREEHRDDIDGWEPPPLWPGRSRLVGPCVVALAMIAAGGFALSSDSLLLRSLCAGACVLALVAFHAWMAALLTGRFAHARRRAIWAREVVDAAPAPMLSFDGETLDVVHANEEACRLLGYETGELVGLNADDLAPAWVKPRIRPSVDQILEARRLTVRDVARRTKNGRTIWVDAHHRVIQHGDRQLVLTAFYDVSDRRTLQDELDARPEPHQVATIVNAAPTPTCAIDILSRRIVQTNQSFCELFGLEAEELADRDVLDLAPEHLRANVAIGLEGLAVAGHGMTSTAPWRRSDGAALVLHIYARVFDAPENPVIIVSATDITEHAEAGAALDDEADAPGARVIVDALPTPACALHIPSRTLLHANPEFCELLGYDLSELEGRPILDLMDSDREHSGEATLTQLSATGVAADRETPWSRQDGSTVWLDVAWRRLDGEDEEIALASLTDVRERRTLSAELTRGAELIRRANEAFTRDLDRLVASEARHRALFTQAAGAVFIVDAETLRLCDANPKACRLSGDEREHLIGLSVEKFDAGGDVSFTDVVSRAIEHLSVSFSEVPFRHAHGKTMYLDVGASLVTYGDERLVQVAFHDVTLYRHLRHTLEKTSEELQRRRAEVESVTAELGHLDTTKSQFLASMSHEIRTPLNAINGFAELLTDPSFGPLNEEQADFVDRIIEAKEHLLQLINDVLDIAKVDAGAIELDQQPAAANRLAEQAVRVIRGMARNEQVSVRILPDEGDPVALADERRVRQVLFNLLANAVRYAPKGSTVDVGVVGGEEWIEITVTDSGRGIPVGDQERIFEDFVRLNPHEDDTGTGLGLPLSRKLVRLHGGDISVVSTPGKGSTFSFTLPVARPPEASPEQPDTIAGVKTGDYLRNN